jgi:hypothetical protein
LRLICSSVQALLNGPLIMFMNSSLFIKPLL